MGSLSTRTLHRAPELPSLGSGIATAPFTHDDVSIPGIVIVLVEVAHQPVRLVIVVHIHHDTIRQRGRQTALFLRGRNQRELGIHGVNGLVDLHEPLRVSRTASGQVVLVPNLDKLEVEGFDPAVLGPLATPGRAVGRSQQVLQLVHDVVDVRLQLVARDDAVVGLAGPHGQHRRHVHVFAPPHELVQAESVGVGVEPVALSAGSLDHGANGVVPDPALGDAQSFDVIPAGETQERRPGGFQERGHIVAKPVRPIQLGCLPVYVSLND